MSNTSPDAASIPAVRIPTSARRERTREEILRERARELARVPVAPGEGSGERFQTVEFVVAGEHYAVAAESVREVYPLKELTPLPCTPPWVRGILNVRGQILTVLDTA